MSDDSIGIVLFFASSFGLWAQYFLGYRPLIVEQTRQDLFEIRDHLFEVAEKYPGTHREDAYKTIRCLLNGSIRFAHEFTALKLLFILFSRSDGRESVEIREHIDMALEQIKEQEVREEIEHALDRMHLTMLFCAINSSIFVRVLSFALIRVAIFAGLMEGYRNILAEIEKRSRKARNAISQLDSDVYDIARSPNYIEWAPTS